LSKNTFLLNESLIVIIAFLYTGWAIGQFYGNKVKNYIKGFLAYFLGFLIFEVVMIGLAIIYDLIKG